MKNAWLPVINAYVLKAWWLVEGWPPPPLPGGSLGGRTPLVVGRPGVRAIVIGVSNLLDVVVVALLPLSGA